MRVRTRNQIIRLCHVFVGLLLFGILVWLCYQASPRKAIGLALGAAVSLAIAFITSEIHTRIIKRETKRILDETGLRKEDLPEIEDHPIPLVPSLARNRDELIAGSVVFFLTITIFVLSWTGVFKKWFGD